MQHLPISPLALCSPQGQGGSGLPLAPWALLLGWCSLQLETNSKHVLLLWRRVVWHEKAFFAQDPATQPEPAGEGPTEVLSQKQQKSRL